ncbi:unnamed protein product [Urochloa humidicola]
MADEPRQGEENPTATAWEGAKLALSMLLVQLIMVGMMLLSELALIAGMNPFVLVVYRNLVAAAAVTPFALIYERETWKKVNLAVWGWIFLNAAFGDVMAVGLYFYGLRVTNAAYSAIFMNLIPIATFIIAIMIRTEKLALGKWTGNMKVLGSLLCVGGMLVVSLLKGKLLHLWPTNLLGYSHAQAPASNAGSHQDVVVGTLLLCGSSLSYALYYIVQAKVVEVFPSKYWMTMLTSLMGSLQAFVVGICFSHDMAQWRLKWDLQLLTVVYSGVFNTGLAFVLLSWVISRSGPIYPPMFNSVSLIITMIIDSILIGTNIYLGSVVGTILIVVGLYAFLWGKGKELKLDRRRAEAGEA